MQEHFYLGTHEPSWLRTAGVPLFVSHRRLSRLRTALPVAAEKWALDSGGFSELSMFGGWKTTAGEYVAAVKRYDDEIGRLEWAAPMDWMCEPDMIARTGLSVVEHQRRTVANYVDLCGRWADVSDTEVPFMPVLQGYAVEDYLRCMDMYAAAGVDLTRVPLVGVGSVCRRQHTDEIRAVFEAILSRDPGLPVHGFGVKSLGLRVYGDLLTTADSMGWSYNARKNAPLAGCTHKSCSNCMAWALRWRKNIVGTAPAWGRPDSALMRIVDAMFGDVDVQAAGDELALFTVDELAAA
ncbi:queuine tRNA-ribosyltransferase [Mycobacterium phage Kratio]|uniref:Queuine tRNA-ribosyltransferase n=4 Tax=Kratiovirus TaxID=2948788 RepID=A0A221J798_9CAUD|nr:queuine tRNA-ribosyltransferase [Mycobacterium phage Larva]YP_009212833.1 queuine tRNA-ribosyltransferase [Mycobacterium phage Kratio]ASM62593.1 queuine tRNA-ribosyltransferase [Mycobacterium phage AlleyCat]QQV92687.1 queuine tRNA-ribosyltransferase [Mycobacterium phage Psycho]WAB09768.1 queuine tRNA-ribosyltransferase [Mycobacterium phage Dadosky]AEL19734.1 queuine tRNA-ribosyltransferase [Mycobacterium phage Larva]AJK27416.1 queuine tRNA-ribosyltransferase [Mycobacterium phage Kratio]